MENRSSLSRWWCLWLVAIAVTVTVAPAVSGAKPLAEKQVAERLGLVTIDVPYAERGRQEMPPVTFDHERHANVLSTQNVGENCMMCHSVSGEGTDKHLIVDTIARKVADGAVRKDASHAYCISCHTARVDKGLATGPVETSCRSCHQDSPAQESGRVEMRFTTFLHNRHTESAHVVRADGQPTCVTCHTKAEDGTKNSCFTCHQTGAEKAATLAKNPAATGKYGPVANFLTVGESVHSLCVGCHLGLAKESKASAPISCESCHSAGAAWRTAEAAPTKVDPLKTMRMDAGQPDFVLMFAESGTADATRSSMLPVSFDHKRHETVTENCATCHHKGTYSCRSCHTVGGKAEGGFVPLNKAMHDAKSSRSCVSCHNTVAAARPECASCHASMPLGMKSASCATCHTVPVGLDRADATPEKLAAKTPEARTELARDTIAKRVATAAERARKTVEVPETVEIGVLANEYEASKLPHGAIVRNLAEKAAGDALARGFHSSELTMCSSCHHYTPQSATPPRCISCHQTTTGMMDGHEVPALKAAYHNQCMGCHAAMNQKPLATDCNGCHTPRMK